MDLKSFPPIDVLSFFQLSMSIKKGEKPKPLFDVSPLLEEEKFAEVMISWLEKGLFFAVKVSKPFEECFFPDPSKGDGFECFIDTKGIENVSLFHKYCHHFVFLPKEVNGVTGAEVSSFRGEEKHELAEPSSLEVKTTFTSKGYLMEIFIPEISLFGYSPEEGSKISLGFKVHRKGGEPMHFPLSGIDYKLESHPELWARLQLI